MREELKVMHIAFALTLTACSGSSGSIHRPDADATDPNAVGGETVTGGSVGTGGVVGAGGVVGTGGSVGTGGIKATGGTRGGAVGAGGVKATGGSPGTGGALGGSPGEEGRTGRAVPTVDPDATYETKALFYNLQSITRNGGSGLLFGMQAALTRGFFWLKSDGTVDWSAGDGVKSDVRTITGKGPALNGEDVADIVGDWWLPTDAYYASLKNTAKTDMRKRMQLHYKRGGINAMCWHMDNYATAAAGDYDGGPHELWRIAPPDVCTQLTSQGFSVAQCGSLFETFKSKVSELADWLLTLKSDNGAQIPVILRMFHENSGGWFWWGAGGPTDARYRATLQGIWKWMVDFLAKTKGVHQVLWAISPNGEAYWSVMSEEKYLSYLPSIDLVDVLGYDFYFEDLSLGTATGDMKMLVGLGRRSNKIAAWTEGGYLTTGYSSMVAQYSGGRVTVINTECQPGQKLYRFWSEKEIGPLLSINLDGVLGGVAWFMAWSSSPNPDGGSIFGPVPGNCTGDDFLGAWKNHQVLGEGEGQGGVAFNYYAMP